MENQEPHQPESQISSTPTSQSTEIHSSPSSPNLLLLIIGALILIGVGLIGGFFLANNHKNTTSQTASQTTSVTEPTPTPQPDPTIDWKTYTNPENEYSIKFPNDTFVQLVCPEPGEELDLELRKTETRDVINADSCGRDTPFDVEIKTHPVNYQLPTSNQYVTVIEKDISVNGMPAKEFTSKLTDKYQAPTNSSNFESVFIVNNNKMYELYLGPLSLKPTFNTILSTLKFTSPTQSTEPATSVQGADLKEIKYTLPSNWTGEIRDNNLVLNANGGGYLAIKVYSNKPSEGRREYYCELTKYCTSSSTFSPMQIGNISGYKAEKLDNSGGGTEYFGAKGDKFYIISSFSPSYPTPNEFDKTYLSVLSSLVF